VTAGHWIDDRRVTDVLDDADVLLLAVTSGDGPHVTPVAFDREGDELWAVVPRRSVKVRAIEQDGRVGALVRHGNRVLVLGGAARLIDPLTGRGLRSLPAPHRLPGAALGFLARNDRRIGRVVRDHPAPTLALSRLGIRLRVRRAALFEGGELLATWKNWPSPAALLPGELSPCPPDLHDLPAGVADLLRHRQDDAVLGWHSPLGAVALPARWHPGGHLHVSTAAMALTGALVAGPACLTVVDGARTGRTIRGVLLRGEGRARDHGATTEVTVAARRTVWWSGTRSGSTARLTGNA
jgi:hypothetical protein